jgi:hypothetical protein
VFGVVRLLAGCFRRVLGKELAQNGPSWVKDKSSDAYSPDTPAVATDANNPKTCNLQAQSVTYVLTAPGIGERWTPNAYRNHRGNTIGFYVDSGSIGVAFDVAGEQKGVALVIAAQFVNQNLQ